MFTDEVYVVAGGGHGLGETVAIELGNRGVTVVVNDLGTSVEGAGESSDAAEETAQAVRDAGGTAMAHHGDVTSFEYTDELVADTVEQYGRLDGIVNFAGVLSHAICYEMEPDDWDRVVRVHLRGHFALLRNAAAHWRDRARDTDDELAEGRSFLAVSSQSALGAPGQANYAAAKAGVLGMVRATAGELGRYNVRVNALMPQAYTRMIEHLPDEHEPFGEDMAPEKVAPMVLYMLSRQSSSLNGRTVYAGGDRIGLVSEPEVSHSGYMEGGWTAERIAERFPDQVASGSSLDAQ